MEIKIEMAPEEMITAVNCYEELKAYRKTGYTPEQVQELHDKHWNECRQIALYDDQIKQMQDHIAKLKGTIDGLCGYLSDCSD